MIKHTTKFISILSILLLSISTLSLTYNSKANIQDQSVFTNPQAILTAQFNDDTYIDNILDVVLPKTEETKDKYGITGLSGLTKVGEQQELISINGQLSPKQTKREFKKQTGTYLAKLESIKEQGTDNLKTDNLQPISNEDKHTLDNELSKISKEDISKARWNYLWGDSKIVTISLSGYLSTLTEIQDQLNYTGHIKNIQLIDTAAMNQELEATKLKIEEAKANNPESKTETEIINDVIQESVKSITTPEQQELIAKSKTLTEEKYALVNSILTKDNNGNNIYNQQDFDNLPLTDQEKEVTKSMIQEFNNIPIYFKTNTQQITNQVEIKTELTVQETVEGLLEGVTEGVKSEAGNGWCGASIKVWNGGFSLTNCRNSFGQLKFLNYGALWFGFIYKAVCALSGGTLCIVVLGSVWLINFLLGQIAGTAESVADVCPNGRAEVVFQIWPIRIGKVNCA